MVRLKILFQSIWRTKLDWDEVLPTDMMKVWTACCNEVNELKDMAISRHAFVSTSSVQIHIFADASQHAFGAVAYARSCDNDGNVFVRFICAKNRVAPINKQNQNELTIPKLELTAALVAARLLNYLRTNLIVQFSEAYLWTDTKITWFWILGSDKRWKPYIENRVREIRSLWDVSSWRHCPGSDNPADLLTRGISATLLLTSELWTNGPVWLRNDTPEWPKSDEINIATLSVFLSSADEAYTSVDPPPAGLEPVLHCETFSSWRRLLRITAYILRAVRCFKTKKRFEGFLSAEELNEAENYWLNNVQRLHFSKEIALLNKEKGIDSNSNLITLNPFLDDVDGLLRVGSRLQFATSKIVEAYPVILP